MSGQERSTSVQAMTARVATVAAAILMLALAVGSARAAAFEPFAIDFFDGGAFDDVGGDEFRAGSYPFLAKTEFRVKTVPANNIFGKGLSGTIMDVYVDVPAGLVGNPLAVPRCPSGGEAVPGKSSRNLCKPDTQVGLVKLVSLSGIEEFQPLYNVEPPAGKPALFKFIVNQVPVSLQGSVRADKDYRVRAESHGAPQTLVLEEVQATLWGVPGDPAHDSDRGRPSVDGMSGPFSCANTGESCSWPGPTPIKPFLNLPTSCVGPVDTDIRIDTWEFESDSATFTSHNSADEPVGNTDCGSLEFEPSFTAVPATSKADSPAGLDVTLRIPQNDSCDPGPPVDCGRATAHLRDSVVTLPEGLNVNPSSANGLDGCSPAEIGLGNDELAQCPDGSKLGTLVAETHVVDHPLHGEVYLADPHDNPFDSLVALYLVVDDPQTGIRVKLPGRVQIGGGKGADGDLAGGQVRAVFEQNPQLPFEELRLNFFEGPRASLRTPETCGNDYATKATFVPWSAPEGQPKDTENTWTVDSAPGGACANIPAQLPKGSSFEAGTRDPVAAAKTALLLNLKRDDATQQFRDIILTPPPGLVGKLAGVPYCAEAAIEVAKGRSGKAEQAAPSCPQASYLGDVAAAAGAGPNPYYAPGRAYLTGPHGGAPLSMAIITPAVAGPFDLGNVVVRTALHVDPVSARIRAVSDPIPHQLEGIPLDVREVQVRIDRSDFISNPTNCDPLSFDGSVGRSDGSQSSLQSPFQVGNCEALGFKPRTNIRLFGGIHRAKYQGVRAVVRPRPGDANISGAVVRFPSSAFVAQEHLQNICTRVQWAADACPANSVYGHAIAYSPLLDEPLRGKLHLRSSDNLLPDLVADLRGPAHQPIKVEVAVKNDSVKGALRNTVSTAPDAPVTYFRMQVFGGAKALIVNSRNICKGRNLARASYRAHNGRRSVQTVPVRNARCAKWRKAQKRKAAKRKRMIAKRRAAARRG